MGKTTKGTQAANQCRLLAIQPNPIPPGGPQPGEPDMDTPPPAAPKFDGLPEGVPDLTFIMEPRTDDDNFITEAIAYHTNCGLEPQEVHSLGHMVELLSEDAGHLGRVRLVTHASGQDLIMPLFGQTDDRNDRHALEPHIQGFAQSDERGILAVLALRFGSHYFNWRGAQFMTIIRNADASLLQPFGLHEAGLPDGNVSQFIFYCGDYVMVRHNRVRRNGGGLGNTNRTNLLEAIDTLINLAVPPNTDGAADLKDFLINLPLADLNIGNASYDYQIPNNAINMFTLAARAAEAVRGGFREKLNNVRNRFNENSTIDIRGCRAGQQISYLRAVQAFFGRENHLPTVSGPRWFQYFSNCEETVTDDNSDIRRLIRNGANAAPNRAAFEDWAERSQINERHKEFWLERLETDDGNVIRFCQLNWRADILPISLQTPGYDAFAAMNFSDAIGRIGVFFNVPNASIPSGGSLNTINTFVTTQLDGFATFLFAEIDDANKAANFTALGQVDDELGTSIVPDSAPNPLNVSDVEGFQRDLIEHIEANQLSAIRDFMQVCRERIEDEDNPGIYYYMLNIGMPVFLFRERDRVMPGHQLQVRNNQIVVHDDFRNEAFRQWPHMLWDEPLPEGNIIDTMTINTRGHRRLAMMVEEPDPGNRRVFACPHPGYMEQLEIVTNNEDPDPFGL